MTGATALAIRDRLYRAKECLEYLELEREQRGDPGFGKRVEDQLVWREMLELELQDAEERITSICDAAERAFSAACVTGSLPAGPRSRLAS